MEHAANVRYPSNTVVPMDDDDEILGPAVATSATETAGPGPVVQSDVAQSTFIANVSSGFGTGTLSGSGSGFGFRHDPGPGTSTSPSFTSAVVAATDPVVTSEYEMEAPVTFVSFTDEAAGLVQRTSEHLNKLVEIVDQGLTTTGGASALHEIIDSRYESLKHQVLQFGRFLNNRCLGSEAPADGPLKEPLRTTDWPATGALIIRDATTRSILLGVFEPKVRAFSASTKSFLTAAPAGHLDERRDTTRKTRSSDEMLGNVSVGSAGQPADVRRERKEIKAHRQFTSTATLAGVLQIELLRGRLSGDESALQAAAREIQEETLGIVPDLKEILQHRAPQVVYFSTGRIFVFMLSIVASGELHADDPGFVTWPSRFLERRCVTDPTSFKGRIPQALIWHNLTQDSGLRINDFDGGMLNDARVRNFILNG